MKASNRAPASPRLDEPEPPAWRCPCIRRSCPLATRPPLQVPGGFAPTRVIPPGRGRCGSLCINLNVASLSGSPRLPGGSGIASSRIDRREADRPWRDPCRSPLPRSSRRDVPDRFPSCGGLTGPALVDARGPVGSCPPRTPFFARFRPDDCRPPPRARFLISNPGCGARTLPGRFDDASYRGASTSPRPRRAPDRPGRPPQPCVPPAIPPGPPLPARQTTHRSSIHLRAATLLFSFAPWHDCSASRPVAPVAEEMFGTVAVR